MASEAQSVGAALADDLLGDGEASGQAVITASKGGLRSVIAFVGMAFEARIAAGPGVLVFSRERRRELAAAAENAARHGCRGIISFGVAGGLASGLKPGDWIVGSAIVEPDATRSTDAEWSRRLCEAIKGARYAPIIGVDAPIAEPATKRELHRTTGAAAVDMESHVVARLAAAHGLAFAALRVIVDPADRAIPRAALMGMGAGARADGEAVLRDLLVQPSQLFRLVRISLDAYIARRAMVRGRRLLGPHFGLTDFERTADAVPPIAPEDLAQTATALYRAPA